MLVKKVNDEWQPAENRGLKVGETTDVTDYMTLIKTGMAVLVDEAGNELELPNQPFTCPICFTTSYGLMAFVDHVSDKHGPKPTPEQQIAAAKAIAGDPEPVQEEVSDEELEEESRDQIENTRESAEPEAGETEEERKERIRKARVENLARARAARKI